MNMDCTFRAKQEGTGKWVYGYYAALPATERFGFMIYTPAANNGESNHVNYVDPATVCRSTGLKDRNGKKIYYGDIVELREYGEYAGRCAVYWDTGAFCLKNEKGEFCGTLFEKHAEEDFTVIGNMFDSPELMEPCRGGENHGKTC